MSLGHMPRWFQIGYGVLCAVGIIVAVFYTATQPTSAPMTPIPQLLAAGVVFSVASLVYSKLNAGEGQ